MKAKTDFLFCVRRSGLKENLHKVCSDADISYETADDLDHLLFAIESQRFRYVFIDLDDETLKPLQTLDWLGTFYLFSKTGIFISKSYKNEFLQALKLDVNFFITQEQYQDEKELKQELRYLIDLTDHVLPTLISGERGTGKKNVAKNFATQEGLKDFLIFDAEEIPDYEQKKKFLEVATDLQGKKNACLCLHHVSSLHAEIQEMVVEFLVHKKMDAAGSSDFRASVMATSSKDLSLLASEGTFREDLYYVLKRFHHKILPLRERRSQIPALIEFFLNDESKIHFFSKDAMIALINYHWPGNDAELRLVVLSILKSATSAVLSAKLLPQEILQRSYYQTASHLEDIFDCDYNEAKKRVLNKFSHDYIAELIKNSDDNLTVAAEKAGMDRSNFKKLMKKFGFE